MLSSGKMVGFIPTKDYDKARAFYEGKLGFEFVGLDKFALVMSVGGHMIRIVKIPISLRCRAPSSAGKSKTSRQSPRGSETAASLRRNIPSPRTKTSASGPPRRHQSSLVQRP